jgi:hypothetical protein
MSFVVTVDESAHIFFDAVGPLGAGRERHRSVRGALRRGAQQPHLRVCTNNVKT